jgi:hypothetical protein
MRAPALRTTLAVLAGTLATACAASACLAAGFEWPPRPKIDVEEPQASCKAIRFSDGRTILAPPSPGLRARAVTARTVEIAWSFRTRPHNCRPAELLLSIVTNRSSRATPLTIHVPASSLKGTKKLTYPAFYPPPNVAMASSVTARGIRSRVVIVRVR